VTNELPLIGLIPAAGLAARLAPLPCSKELLPIGFTTTPDGPRPRPVCLYLLERLRRAGIERALIVLRQGKWDIPAYLGHGAQFGLSLGYLIMGLPHGSPYTLDQAYPFVRGCTVALGLPDIIFEPTDAYAHLLAHIRATGADLVLGLFPNDQPHTADMVELDEAGHVKQIVIKPPRSDLRYSWMICVWSPRFTEFLHTYLVEVERSRADPDPARRPQGEIFLGHVFQAAMRAGLLVSAVPFPEGTALDVGTPEHLRQAVWRYAGPAEGV